MKSNESVLLEQKVRDIGESMAENLSQLEERIHVSVEGVRSAVQEAGVLIDRVKNEVKLKARTQAHPIAMLGMSVVAGVVLGDVLFDSPHRRSGIKHLASKFDEEIKASRWLLFASVARALKFSA